MKITVSRIGALIAMSALAQMAKASTLQLANVTVGSAFSTCLGPTASTNDGTTAFISCGGTRLVTGFLPVSMSTQALASANPGGAGARVIVDIQNAINTGGVVGFSNDPALFNSSVGYNLDIQTQDDVTFSAGASAVFTWGIHEHIVNLGNGFISETASFGFTPVLFDSDVVWDCTRDCSSIGTIVPGVGSVVDMNLTRTQRVNFTPGQVLHVFDRMNLNGDINGGNPQANAHVELDFLDPITVRAQVFDALGNPLTNVTATSALGVNYLGASAPTSAPEPGTLSLIGVGLLAISRIRRVKKVKRRESRSTPR